jgi:hypothetical protein
MEILGREMWPWRGKNKTTINTIKDWTQLTIWYSVVLLLMYPTSVFNLKSTPERFDQPAGNLQWRRYLLLQSSVLSSIEFPITILVIVPWKKAYLRWGRPLSPVAKLFIECYRVLNHYFSYSILEESVFAHLAQLWCDSPFLAPDLGGQKIQTTQ